MLEEPTCLNLVRRLPKTSSAAAHLSTSAELRRARVAAILDARAFGLDVAQMASVSLDFGDAYFVVLQKRA